MRDGRPHIQRDPPRRPRRPLRASNRRAERRTALPETGRPDRRWWLATVLFSIAAGFWIGRTTPWGWPPHDEAPQAPSYSADDPSAHDGDGASPELAVTSTAGLCPCPAPRPKKASKKLTLPRRPVPAVPTAPHENPDPTAATARYLKESALRFSECRPATGSALRAHLELTIAPTGRLDRLRITNLEPLPVEISKCIERVARSLEPPGFDGMEAETFGLTVVL